MKTLKTLLVTLMLATFAMTTFAIDYNESRFEIQNSTDLRTTIKKMLSDDFVNVNNYFHKHGISDLKDDVLVKFFIDENNRFQVVDVEGGSDDAKSYVKQLLNNKKVNASDAVVKKSYQLSLKIDYRS
jgi:hypothetical protein